MSINFNRGFFGSPPTKRKWLFRFKNMFNVSTIVNTIKSIFAGQAVPEPLPPAPAPVPAKSQESTTVQSLVFKKSMFNRASARKWAESHGFKNSKVDVTRSSIRLRQFSSGTCKVGSFKIKSLTTGVSAILCRRK